MTRPEIQRITPAKRRARRVSLSTGWAYAGSQRHIQAYVNTPELTKRMDQELRATFKPLTNATLEWRTPLAEHRYDEPRDDTFWAAINRPELAALARSWWPNRGPSWDAIALAHPATGPASVVLIEAKANVPEFTAGAFAATNSNPIKMIQTALDHVRTSLGSGHPLSAWTGPHYQLANRLTWTHWLKANGVPTLFVYLVFVDDRSHLPTSRAELTAEAVSGFAALGLSDRADWYATLALPASR